MSLFFLTFFLLYGGMHFYAYRKITAAVMLPPWLSVCLILFMAVMVLMPAIIGMTEKLGLEIQAIVLAHAGYAWMGLIFLFFCASSVLDLYRLLLHLAGLFSGRDFSHIALSDSNLLLAAVACSVSVSLYGYFEALNIRTERVVVESPRIPAEIGRITLVQISDVHLGLIVRRERLERIVLEIRKVNPDILVSTGDLVDSQIDDLAKMADALREFRPRYGKYAVTGNHEYYAGIAQALDFTRKAGFMVLSGESRDVAGIRIAGVDDPVAYRMGTGRNDGEKKALRGLSPGKFTLFLKHRPALDRDSIGLFDLQLSGHIHKGQIFPFNLVTSLFYPVGTGLTRLPGGGSLYVSRGTGTWGPPIRFMAPPEVTVIELVHSEPAVSVSSTGSHR